MRAGDCFWTFDHVRDGVEGGHLYFILLDPDQKSGETVVVPCCTIRDHFHDASCLLSKGEHKFINGPSFADYYHALIVTVDEIDERIRAGVARMKASVSSQVLKRLQDGMVSSPHSPSGVRSWFVYRYQSKGRRQSSS